MIEEFDTFKNKALRGRLSTNTVFTTASSGKFRVTRNDLSLYSLERRTMNRKVRYPRNPVYKGHSKVLSGFN